MGGYRSHSETIPFALPDVLRGMILQWHGLVSTIPSGFALCDGNNGTPDLRERFIVCAQNDGQVGNVGGTSNQSHTFTGDGHTHPTVHVPPYTVETSVPTDKIQATNVTGTTDQSDNRPPFYTLAFIMKL